MKWHLDEKTKNKSHIVVEQSLCVSELTEIVITKGQKDEEKCDKGHAHSISFTSRKHKLVTITNTSFKHVINFLVVLLQQQVPQ